MNQQEQVVLFVDDEEYVLRALKRVCRNEPFSVITADSGSAALKLLEQNQVDLIVSDLRMPGMDGSELLSVVSELYPGMPRILLSGNADLPSVIKTVNEGKLSYYFQKPWDDDAIRLTLRSFLERKQLKELEIELNQKIQAQNEELIELNAKLEEQAETILKEGEIKSRFFSTMSHEIRTPLNGMLGVLQLLTEGDMLEPEKERLLKTCCTTAMDLKRIADDALDYSKLESNKMVLENISFEPANALDPLIELLVPTAKKKSLELTFDTASVTDLSLIGDPIRVRQIVANLLTNAIKYTESGTVTLRVSFDKTTGLEIEVTDTGIGISPDRRKLLFQEFQMLDSAHHRKYGGTGLGLSIVKRLVEQMNGGIQVQSELGRGSTFSVTLPLRTSTTDDIQNERVIDLCDQEFLVVDDNEANLLIIEAALTKHRASVTTAQGGLPAILKLQESNHFSAVLLDINMPDLDGLETLSIIQQDKLFNGPVYAITAQIDADSVEQFEAAGFDAVLDKPLDLKLLARLLGNEDVETSKQTNQFDRDKFLELIDMTGREAADSLVDAFVRDCDTRASLIEEALTRKDGEEVARQAHAINNSAAMFGATALYQLCKKLDQSFKADGLVDLEDAAALIPLMTSSKATVSDWLETI